MKCCKYYVQYLNLSFPQLHEAICKMKNKVVDKLDKWFSEQPQWLQIVQLLGY